MSAPAKAVAGQVVHLSGSGFRAGTTVKVVLSGPGRAAHQVVASTVAGSNGQFHTAVRVPKGSGGTHVLRVVGTSRSGKPATVAARMVVLTGLTEAVRGSSDLATPVLLAIAVGLPLATWAFLELPVGRRKGGDRPARPASGRG